MQAILIPVKHLAVSKQRLSESLPAEARRRLGLAMLADVLDATREWDRWVVTIDSEAEALSTRAGCRLVPDPGTGLNDAIRAGTEAAVGLGVQTLLVLPADVPLVEPADVLAVFDSEADVGVVESSDGGTNALLRRPPAVLNPTFGPRSAERHIEQARAAGLNVAVLEAPSLKLDIDLPGDLSRLAESGSGRTSARLARELV